MRVLQLHCDFFEYEPVRKEIDAAEQSTLGKHRFEEVVVAFVTVEEGDNDDTVKKIVEETKASMSRLGCNQLLIYPYSHLSRNLASPEQALRVVKLIEEHSKNEGISVKRSPFGWNKAFSIGVKGHPLAEQSREISAEPKAERKSEEVTSKALVEEERLRSEWMILEPSGRMIPIGEYDFSGHEGLKVFSDYEIAKVRAVQKEPAHVSLMRRLGLVDYEPGSDSGNMRFYPKGKLLKALLESYVTQKVKEYGGLEVETPVMYDFQHPSLASYLNRFPARQYVVKSEDKDFFLRFSACFGQFLMAKDAQISYRNLPLKLYELTRYSFRREKSGELIGLRRLRAFTMPDCHALCADLEQAKSEALKRMKLSLDVLNGIGLSWGDFELAVRFTKDFYEKNRDFVNTLVGTFGRPALVEVWSERFFYFILKWEFNFTDTTGKSSALSTDQIDVENAERYGITYVDEDGSKKHPMILHNSPSGAIERCIYALLEQTEFVRRKGGVPTLPTWLSPTQVRLIPVASQYLDAVQKIADKYEAEQIRVDVDDRDETVQKKIREAEREWVPYIVLYGEKEAESKRLSVRDRAARKIIEYQPEELLLNIKKQEDGKPFLPLPLPRLLSLRPIFSASA